MFLSDKICFYKGQWVPLLEIKEVKVEKIRQNEVFHRLYVSGNSFPRICFWLERSMIPVETQIKFLELNIGNRIDFGFVISGAKKYTHASIVEFTKHDLSLLEILIRKYKQHNLTSDNQFHKLLDEEETLLEEEEEVISLLV